jgi:2-methylcitrate dehydratase PrpD
MSGIAKSTPIEELSANVLNTRFENFDQKTLEKNKNRIIDVVGCLIGGANASGNQALVELVKEWGGKEEATILIHGGKVPALHAAMVNGIMARSFDFEALSPLVEGKSVPAHISGTTIMTVLTLREIKGIDGKELFAAIMVGDNMASRVLAASNYDFTLGWDCTGTVNVIGATAIAGRLLGLNEKQLRNAFGLALNQLGGSFQSIWDGTTDFKLPQGMSARNGIFAAQLAKAGWTGPDDLLLSKFGYYHLYTAGCVNPDILTKDLGKKYYADATIKPYSCCRGNHGAIECALAIVSKHDISADDIEEVILYASQYGLDNFLGQSFKIGDFPHACACFNYQYAVADALIRKGVRPGHYSEESIRDPHINTLIKKVRLALLENAETPLTNRVTVRMKNGQEFSEFISSLKGDSVKNPMTKEEIIAKFWANVGFSKTVTEKNAEKLLGFLEKLEGLDNVNKIVGLLINDAKQT